MTRLMIGLFAASSATRRPTAVEPVNEITRGIGFEIKASPISLDEPTTMLRRPGGSPASSKIFASSRPPATGVYAEGLRTTALPRARAGPTARCERYSGKFQGLITPTTPTGRR